MNTFNVLITSKRMNRYNLILFIIGKKLILLND